MPKLLFTDGFETLEHWTGNAVLDATGFTTPPSSMVASGRVISRRTFLGIDAMEIKYFDDLGTTFYCNLELNERVILQISGTPTFFTITEGIRTTTTTAARSPMWHTIRIEIDTEYRVFIDGTKVYSSIYAAAKAFDVVLGPGQWDDFRLEKEYEDLYQSGTGQLTDMEVDSAVIQEDGTVLYTVKKGFFYVDDIEYYKFAAMGKITIDCDPSGGVTYTHNEPLPYIPGGAAFVVGTDDINEGSGYARVPVYKEDVIAWEGHGASGYVPTVTSHMQNTLVYESGTLWESTLSVPLGHSSLVWTDDVQSPAKIRTGSTYLDTAKQGDDYQAWAEVRDAHGAPIQGVTVSWKYISADNSINDAGSSVTNSSGIATKEIPISTSSSIHVYAEADVLSKPRWIQVPLDTISIAGGVFQLDESDIYLDSQEARTAVGQNCWGEVWGSDPGEATGVTTPSTHGQWEALYPQYERAPITAEDAADETTGAWNANDFAAAYPAIVAAAGSTQDFMDPMLVARNGYWGQPDFFISATAISDPLGPIDPSQVQNKTDVYDIKNNSGTMITGSWQDVYDNPGTYAGIYYVFYQKGSDYSGNSPDTTGNVYFRGMAVFDEEGSQANSTVAELLSNTHLK